MTDFAGHPSDDELTDVDGDQRDGRRVQQHIAECSACRARRDEALRLRELLAQAGQRERRPIRDVVPSAMMRLRLRRHSVTNANELLGGFAAFMRAVASLFSLPAPDRRSSGAAPGVKDERHE